MAGRFTPRSVESIKGNGTRREIADGLLPGFYLVVQPSGAKSWAIRYRSPVTGKHAKHTLGSYSVLSLANARADAAAALRMVQAGGDPSAARKADRAKARKVAAGEDAIENVFAKFMKRRLKKKKQVPLKASTLKGDQWLFDRRIAPEKPAKGQPSLRGYQVQDVTKEQLIELLDYIVDNGAPVLANRALAVLRRFFNWCVEKAILPASPCAGIIAPGAEGSRDRKLDDLELRALWKFAEKQSYPFGPIVQLLILTGQRLDEVRSARWSEFEGDIWALPGARTKNGRDHDVPLSPEAKAVLVSLPRIDGSDLLFTTNGRKPVSGLSKFKERARTSGGCPDRC